MQGNAERAAPGAAGDARSAPAPGLYDRAAVLVLTLLAPLVLVFIVLHMLWGMFAAGLLFPVLPAAGRDALVQFWSRLTLVALGIRLETRGAAGVPARGSLLLVNHTSWADVFVIAAVTPARFVAKSEIAGWPVLGWFASAVGTLFVERGRRHAVSHVNHLVAERLRAGQSVGIFPEGTTTDGSRLLRFHANLVQAALETGAPAVPLGLRYEQDGMPSTAAAYIDDMNLAGSLWRILRAPRLTAVLHFLPALQTEGANRQAIGREARAAIATALALPMDDRPAAALSPAEASDREPAGPGATAS